MAFALGGAASIDPGYFFLAGIPLVFGFWIWFTHRSLRRKGRFLILPSAGPAIGNSWGDTRRALIIWDVVRVALAIGFMLAVVHGIAHPDHSPSHRPPAAAVRPLTGKRLLNAMDNGTEFSATQTQTTP